MPIQYAPDTQPISRTPGPARWAIGSEWALLALLALLASGCNREGSSGSSSSSSTPIAETPITVDTVGELDPIANPAAVKGGTYTTWGSSFPKSLNMWSEYTSFNVEVMGLMYENLVSLHSTKNAPVGVLAAGWEISEDKKTFTFHIDPRARWSDGQRITAADFRFYYDVIMNPKHLTSVFRVGLQRFDPPEAVDSLTLRVRAREAHWNNFWEAAGLVAFPRHAWKDQDFNEMLFDFPVVSGPYKIGELKKERTLVLTRRGDWWGRVKRYNQNKYNFDHIRYRFMEDRNKALEAFKKGEFDAYAVYTAAIWAQKTRFEAVDKGWVARNAIYNQEPKGFQGFAINLRRPLFQDVRVRQALGHLLNRELMNDKLMFNQYYLLNSYYPDLYPNNVNPDVPMRAYDPEKARALLAEAGWKAGKDGILEKDGARFQVSMLTSTSDLRHYNVYLEDLKRMGIDASLEQMSHSSVRKRIDDHEFDLYWAAWGAGRLRDPEASWSSKTADEPSTSNIAGVRDALVDSLIEAQKTELDLDKRNALLKRLDARLNEIIPYVFLWGADHTRLLHWRRYGTPEFVLDKFNREDAILTYWYLDPEKSDRLAAAMAAGQALEPDTAAIRYRGP